jgi:hypothetical protein
LIVVMLMPATVLAAKGTTLEAATAWPLPDAAAVICAAAAVAAAAPIAPALSTAIRRSGTGSCRASAKAPRAKTALSRIARARRASPGSLAIARSISCAVSESISPST